jgi:hypothetical protein
MSLMPFRIAPMSRLMAETIQRETVQLMLHLANPAQIPRFFVFLYSGIVSIPMAFFKYNILISCSRKFEF